MFRVFSLKETAKAFHRVTGAFSSPVAALKTQSLQTSFVKIYLFMCFMYEGSVFMDTRRRVVFLSFPLQSFPRHADPRLSVESQITHLQSLPFSASSFLPSSFAAVGGYFVLA